MLCWANNDGACGRRCPRWRRCCTVLGGIVAVLLLMCTTCAFTALVAALWCGSRHLLWFHHIGAAPGGSSLLGWGSNLWAGDEAKAFACLQANDGDILGRHFPSWRHHSFAPSPVPPMAGPMIGSSSVVLALLHFPRCRLGCLGRGRGGCFAALS